MSNTKLNKNQAGEGILTNSNVIGKNGVTTTWKQPTSDAMSHCVALWHFDRSATDEVNNVIFYSNGVATYYDSPLLAKFGESISLPQKDINLSELIPIGNKFTIDFWGLNTYRFYTKISDSQHGPMFDIQTNNIVVWKSPAESERLTFNFSEALSSSELNHILICLDANRLFVYKNGKNILNADVSAYESSFLNMKFSNLYQTVSGNPIDELRILDICEYGIDYVNTGFDVPTEPYSLNSSSDSPILVLENSLYNEAYTKTNLVAGPNITISQNGYKTYKGAAGACLNILANKLSSISTASSWSIKIHTDATQSTSQYATLLSSSQYGIYIGEGSRPFRTWGSSDNLSWNLWSAISLTDMTNMYNLWVEIGFSGTTYYLKWKKKESDSYTNIILATTTSKIDLTGGLTLLNNQANLVSYYYPAVLHMKDLQIEADGVNIFDGRTAVLGTDYTITGDMEEDIESNPFYEISGHKEMDLTSISGYNESNTQVLKNINGTLTWVDEE